MHRGKCGRPQQGGRVCLSTQEPHHPKRRVERGPTDSDGDGAAWSRRSTRMERSRSSSIRDVKKYCRARHPPSFVRHAPALPQGKRAARISPGSMIVRGPFGKPRPTAVQAEQRFGRMETDPGAISRSSRFRLSREIRWAHSCRRAASQLLCRKRGDYAARYHEPWTVQCSPGSARSGVSWGTTKTSGDFSAD